MNTNLLKQSRPLACLVVSEIEPSDEDLKGAGRKLELQPEVDVRIGS